MSQHFLLFLRFVEPIVSITEQYDTYDWGTTTSLLWVLGIKNNFQKEDHHSEEIMLHSVNASLITETPEIPKQACFGQLGAEWRTHFLVTHAKRCD